MGLQPFDSSEKLFYPSAQPLLSAGIYGIDGLKPAGDRLYTLQVGDFAYPVLAPIPHVEMTIFALDDATATITLYRTVGRRTMPVRGMVRVFAIGGVNVVDWEAPFGVALTYRAAQYDAAGNFIAYTNPSTTQLDVYDTWLHNPLDPAGSVKVRLARGAGADIERPQDADIDWADGAGVGTAVTSQRHGVVGTPIAFWTLTDADSDKVNEILGDPYEAPSGPSIVVLRPGANENTRWPKPFIAHVSLVEHPVGHPAGKQYTRWDGTGTEVEPPAVALVLPVLTYDDIDAAFDSYDEMDAAYGSTLERDRDYSLAGLANTNGNSDGESGPAPTL